MVREYDMSEAEEWFAYLRSCGRKDVTIENYRKDLRCVFWRLEDGGRSYKAADITQDDILFLRNILTTKEEVTHEYLRVLARFVVFHTGKDVVKQSNLLWNREHRDRTFVQTEDWAKMYRVADPLQRVILMLGGFMGLRRAEMWAIKDSDIRGHKMTIHGKGHGNQGFVVTVNIPQPVLDEIASFRRYKSQFPNSGDGFLLQAIFLNEKDRGMTHIALSTMSNTVKKLAKKANVDACCHGLRRMFATNLYYEMECDINSLKNLMRHAEVSTTFKCYIDAYEKNEREAMSKLTDYMSNALGKSLGVGEGHS